MRNISIHFGGIKAVDDVSIDVMPGEVVGLLGHNGAGKSTLIKILSGAYKKDAGEIYVDGKKVEINSPIDARTHNIETIYQTLALSDNLDAASATSFLAARSRPSSDWLMTQQDGSGIAQDHGASEPQLPTLL